MLILATKVAFFVTHRMIVNCYIQNNKSIDIFLSSFFFYVVFKNYICGNLDPFSMTFLNKLREPLATTDNNTSEIYNSQSYWFQILC